MFSRLSRDKKSVSKNFENLGVFGKKVHSKAATGPSPVPLGRGPLLHQPTAHCLLSVPFQLSPVERPSFVLKGTSPHDAGGNIPLFIRAI